jgi:hypothetical protein
VITGFFSLLQLIACVRALAVCLRERFAVGVAGGVARIGLMVLQAAALASSPLSLIPGLHRPAMLEGWAGTATVVGALGGPVVSFGVLVVAYLHARNVPAAEEERLRRPFTAWLPVGVMDGIFVALQLFGLWLGVGNRG